MEGNGNKCLSVPVRSKTNLGVDQTILWARDEDVAFDFHEVRQLRRVELPNADGICLLLCPRKEFPDMFYHGEVLC